MLQRFAPVFGLATLVSVLFGASPASAQYWQCVTYAREISGVQIRGNANTWWGQAAGIYDRGQRPREGAVLAFKSIPGMRAGHVAMVSRVVNDREVLLTHANWSYSGQVERDVRAIDVSDAGDWSEVRVWHGPSRGLGIRTNAAYGFIYPDAAPARAPREPLLGSDVIQLAMLELRQPALLR